MHKACHFELKIRNRTNTASIVGTAAYCTGGRYRADRTGQRHDYRRRRDVVSVESIRMPHDPERIWNLADAAEKHPRGRTAREFVVSLPAELPLDVQRKLVRGYCLWLHDTFGMSSMAAVHHPYFDGMDKEILADLRPATEGRKRPARYRGGERGNPLNQHVHILCPTRRWDPETETFGRKLRELDDVRTGPEFVQQSRDEWQARVNRALEKQGVAERVDLRSYERQAAAGDAPEGLVAQPKAGPRNTARSRRRVADEGEDDTVFGRSRAEIRAANDALWASWLALRAAGRERAREEVSDRLAEETEARRRAEAVEAEAALQAATTADERAAAIAAAPHLDCLDPWAQAAAWARAKPDADTGLPWDMEVDPETQSATAPVREQPPKVMIAKVHQKQFQRQRNRGSS